MDITSNINLMAILYPFFNYYNKYFLIDKILIMTNYSESIEALNDLIQINHDRVAGYDRAVSEMKESDNLGTALIFEQYLKDSSTNINQLSQYVREMGGAPADSSTISGKVHRLWMDIKSTFATHDKESALESCIFGDSAAIKAYEAAIADTTNGFSSEILGTLNRHLIAIKLAHTANEAYEKTLEKFNS